MGKIQRKNLRKTRKAKKMGNRGQSRPIVVPTHLQSLRIHQVAIVAKKKKDRSRKKKLWRKKRMIPRRQHRRRRKKMNHRKKTDHTQTKAVTNQEKTSLTRTPRRRRCRSKAPPT